MTERDSNQQVSGHYDRADLGATILQALQAAGKGLGALTPDDLAPVDQFHTRGKPATLELARLAGLQAGERVLDIGGGLGGAARTLATEYGCTVTVLDLAETYCRVGAMLTERTGLGDRVAFHQGTALDLPFPAASFDVAWTQHSSMNVADKERLYAEVHRVLRPGGRLALHEILAGPVQPIHFPIHWAAEPSISFLAPPDEHRAVLRRRGFVERAWVDVSEASLEVARGIPTGPNLPPLGLHLLLGPLFDPVVRNLVRNLAEQRIAIVEAVFVR
jgi:SAM-dependent methyltransferase